MLNYVSPPSDSSNLGLTLGTLNRPYITFALFLVLHSIHWGERFAFKRSTPVGNWQHWNQSYIDFRSPPPLIYPGFPLVTPAIKILNHSGHPTTGISIPKKILLLEVQHFWEIVRESPLSLPILEHLVYFTRPTEVRFLCIRKKYSKIRPKDSSLAFQPLNRK